jgi:hypothetical protein
MFLDKDRTMENVQKHNICTYFSYFEKIIYLLSAHPAAYVYLYPPNT